MNSSVIQSPQPKPVKRWSVMAFKLVLRDIGSWMVFFGILAAIGLFEAVMTYSDIEADPGLLGNVASVFSIVITALLTAGLGYVGVNAAQRADLGYGATSPINAFKMGFLSIVPIMMFALPIFMVLELFVFSPSRVNEMSFTNLWLESNVIMGINIILHPFLKGFLAIPAQLCVGMDEKEVDQLDKEFRSKEQKLRFFLMFLFLIPLYFATMVMLVLNPVISTIICLVAFPWMSAFVYVAGREMIGGISENKTATSQSTVATPALT